MPSAPWPARAPSVGCILGSGLGGLADVLEDASFVEYASIPGFPFPPRRGTPGRFVLGRLAGHGVVCMQGRFHFYEGHPCPTSPRPSV